MKMMYIRVKSILCFIFFGVTILLIYFCSNNRNITERTINHFQSSAESKSNSNDKELELYDYEDSQRESTYVTANDLLTFEKDLPFSVETEPDLQSYEWINKIEYIDYIVEDDNFSVDKTHADSDTVSLKHLLSVCIKAAKAGGMQLRSVRRNFDLKKIWGVKYLNESNRLLSIGRRLSHRAITYTLKNAFPDIKLVSPLYNGFEIKPYEGEFQIQNSSDDVLVPKRNILVWLDPLDAENEYKENFLEYVTTMVCVAVAGKPVIGVIHQPFENFTKWGWVGQGASNFTFRMASEPDDTSKPLTILASVSQRDDLDILMMLAFRYHMDIIGTHGAGFKTLQLLEGRGGAYLHLMPINKWKTCAGNAIINAVNGKMTTLGGSDIDYGNPVKVINARGLTASVSNSTMFSKLAILESDIELKLLTNNTKI